jgi:large subunit ribosomal protein L4
MSVKTIVYNQSAEPVGDLALSEKVFKVTINENLVHQAVVTQMANERQVLAHTKTKAEVRGGGKKPWKQKGTGRARAGSSRSPLWIGGGIIFGPRKDRNFSKKINKKMKTKALYMTLSDKLANNQFIILDKFEIADYKTKVFNEILNNFEKKVIKNDRRNWLVINDDKNEKVKVSGRNLKGVDVINLENINIVDVLKHPNLLIPKEAVNKLVKTKE